MNVAVQSRTGHAGRTESDSLFSGSADDELWAEFRRDPDSGSALSRLMESLLPLVNRAIERKVTQLHGRKSLYSTSFYERDEFYDIYGGDAYAGLKQEYDPDGRFPDLYDKTCGSTREDR